MQAPVFPVNMLVMMGMRLRHTGAQLGTRRGARVGGREVDLHQVAQAVVGPHQPAHPLRLPCPISSASSRGDHSRHSVTSIAQPARRPFASRSRLRGFPPVKPLSSR